MTLDANNISDVLEIVGYEQAKIRHLDQPDSVLDLLELLQQATAGYPVGPTPLAELYPHVARTAALSLMCLAALPHSYEIEDLHGFEGLAE